MRKNTDQNNSELGHFLCSEMPYFLLKSLSKLLKATLQHLAKIGQRINSFVPNATFLHPMKTSEKLRVLYCFQGVQKESIGNEWVKYHNRKANFGIDAAVISVMSR